MYADKQSHSRFYYYTPKRTRKEEREVKMKICSCGGLQKKQPGIIESGGTNSTQNTFILHNEETQVKSDCSRLIYFPLLEKKK